MESSSSSTTGNTSAAENDTPAQNTEDNPPSSDAFKCLYVENCTTGSQPRKAISHIFGRNKLCTRTIPSHIWVHFCRKHYQRGRYRNGKEYARLQCNLIIEQIRRIQAWSDENRRAGHGSVVTQWAIALRKRERGREQENRNKVALGQARQPDHPDLAVVNGSAVPDWLRSQVREGYQTPELIGIAERMRDEVIEKDLEQIPDIEFLPTMREATDLHVETRSPLKRKHSSAVSASSHQRIRSAIETSGPGPRSALASATNGESAQADPWQLEPPEKRQRIPEAARYQERAVYPPPPEPRYARAMGMAPERAMPRQYTEAPVARANLPSYPLERPISQNGNAYYVPASPRESPRGPYERQENHDQRRPSHYRSQYDNENYYWGSSTFSSHPPAPPPTYGESQYRRPEWWPRNSTEHLQPRYTAANETLPPIRSWDLPQAHMPVSAPETNFQHPDYAGFGHQHHRSNPLPARGYGVERQDPPAPTYPYPPEPQPQSHRPYEYRREGTPPPRLPPLDRFD